ncbi:MAG TPA: ATP-binding protein [Fimbriimonadaceae bacterium]|jgi:hypothetical protein
MIPKELIELSAIDIEWLITNQVCESQTLEYKEILNIGDPKTNREFARDVTAFANSFGGDLIVGVKSVDGLPSAIVGVEENEDELSLRIDNILRSHVHPRLHLEPLKYLTVQGKRVLLIRVPRSFIGPHIADTKGDTTFFARSSAGKFQMNVGQVRSQFLNSQSISRDMRNFIGERLTKIAAENDRLWGLGRGVIHLLPLASFTDQYQADLTAVWNLVQATNHSGPFIGYRNRYNFEGILQDGVNQMDALRRVTSASQFYRNGVVECVETGIAITTNTSKGWGVVQNIDKCFLEGTLHRLRILERAGVPNPVWVVWSILGLDGCNRAGEFLEDFKPIDSNRVQLPEVEFREYPPDLESLTAKMKSALDVLWQSMGRPAYRL